MNETPAPPLPPSADPGTEAFKAAFRRHAAGVAAITALTPEGVPVGFTATSLASLAAVPPLATFNMSRVSTAWPAMVLGNRVVIHMLGPKTRDLAQRMAADHAERFAGDHWERGPHGLPVLRGVTAWMIGRVIDVHPVHGNAVVVVEIEEGELGPEDEALLYHERTYLKPAAL
jgi:flavin reductase (DIM6/NTAB) family NADH-FMN oxidoreductase RutF